MRVLRVVAIAEGLAVTRVAFAINAAGAAMWIVSPPIDVYGTVFGCVHVFVMVAIAWLPLGDYP